METAFLALRLLMAIVLYVFLGWLLWLQWRQLQAQTRQAAIKRFPDLLLTNQEDDELVYRFSRSEVIVGRQPGSDLRLQDGTISARHTRLSYHDGQWWVEDLQSKNGTFINDEPVTAPVVLAEGDLLRCGAVQLVIGIQTRAIPTNNG